MTFRSYVTLACLLLGCGGKGHLSMADASTASTDCVPGRQVSCDCRGGSASVQVCRKDHTFGPCDCGSPDAGAVTPIRSAVSGTAGRSSAVSGTGGTDASAPKAYTYGDVTPCDVSDTALMLDGESGDYIHPGYDLITVARFSVNPSAAQTVAELRITPSGQAHGLWWSPTFSSDQLGEPLQAKEYLDAERWPFETYLKPGLDISGDGRGCNMLSGKFKIVEIAWSGATLTKLRVAFEQHCELGTPALRGCLRYVSPDAATDNDAGGH